MWKYKILMKETEDNTNENIFVFINWRVNIVKIFIPLKTICRFSEISIKILKAFFIVKEKNPKICMKLQKTLNIQSHAEKERRKRNSEASHFKLHYKDTISKTLQ